jgi:hypothetical protein
LGSDTGIRRCPNDDFLSGRMGHNWGDDQETCNEATRKGATGELPSECRITFARAPVRVVAAKEPVMVFPYWSLSATQFWLAVTELACHSPIFRTWFGSSLESRLTRRVESGERRSRCYARSLRDACLSAPRFAWPCRISPRNRPNRACTKLRTVAIATWDPSLVAA